MHYVKHDWLWLFCPLLPMTYYPCFQLQLYIGSAAMVHRRRLRRRHCHQPLPPIPCIYIEALVPYQIDRVLILNCRVRHITSLDYLPISPQFRLELYFKHQACSVSEYVEGLKSALRRNGSMRAGCGFIDSSGYGLTGLTGWAHTVLSQPDPPQE